MVEKCEPSKVDNHFHKFYICISPRNSCAKLSDRVRIYVRANVVLCDKRHKDYHSCFARESPHFLTDIGCLTHALQLSCYLTVSAVTAVKMTK
jgi:hypothetical protein